MKRYILALLLALAASLLLCSCGSSLEPAVKSTWKMTYAVDEFGDKTGDIDIVATVYGKFSNTATTDSDLKVEIIHDPTDTRGGYAYFTIRLYEYQRNTPSIYSGDKPTLKIKIADKIYEQRLPYDSKTSDLFIYDAGFTSECYEPMYDTLFNNAAEIRCIITSWKSTYEFTLDGSGFSDAVTSIMTNAPTE